MNGKYYRNGKLIRCEYENGCGLIDGAGVAYLCDTHRQIEGYEEQLKQRIWLEYRNGRN